MRGRSDVISSWFPAQFVETGFLVIGVGYVLGVMIALIRESF
jgi:hypothetical protein